jgi:hypothetical protein
MLRYVDVFVLDQGLDRGGNGTPPKLVDGSFVLPCYPGSLARPAHATPSTTYTLFVSSPLLVLLKNMRLTIPNSSEKERCSRFSQKNFLSKELWGRLIWQSTESEREFPCDRNLHVSWSSLMNGRTAKHGRHVFSNLCKGHDRCRVLSCGLREGFQGRECLFVILRFYRLKRQTQALLRKPNPVTFSFDMTYPS